MIYAFTTYSMKHETCHGQVRWLAAKQKTIHTF